MIIVYRPGDGEERRWDLKVKGSGKLKASEGELVEDTVGLTWGEFEAKLLTGWLKGFRVLTWVLLRRDDPELTLGDFDPDADEFDVDFDSGERAQLRAEVERATDLTPALKAEALSNLADAGGSGSPKDPSGSKKKASPPAA
jgi:hypothetical protein